MDWIVVEGVKPWDGRYEFDLATSPLTTREWGFIKRLTGYLPVSMGEGLEGTDPELYACFATIALRRAGKVDNQQVPNVFERIIDTPLETTIRLETDTAADEDDAAPLPPSGNGNTDTSGPDSPASSDTLILPPKRSGMPGSDSSPSDRQTSVT